MQTKLVFPLLFVIADESVEPMWETITTTDAEGVGTTSSTYYYVVNAQGDVIRLVSANGATVAEYAYDPYGKVVSATGTIAEVNPLRYRSYYYDTESEFYYLQSRYYDPAICRFINADGYASTGQGFLGCNMFAYCNNAPTNCADYSGHAAGNMGMSYSAEITGTSAAYKEYMELKALYAALGITLYDTAELALAAWIAVYLPKSSVYEHVVYLYSVDTSIGTRYYFSKTYQGSKGNAIMSPNVIEGTLRLQAEYQYSQITFGGYLPHGTLVAAVHTHPDPGEGFHSDFPSYSSDIYGGDRIAYELFNLPEMYIVPYKRCEGTPQIIVYSDRSTWCSQIGGG